MRTKVALRDGWQVFKLPNGAGDLSEILKGGTPEGWDHYDTVIPAEVHDILMNRAIIPDPRLGKNAALCAWVGDEDWAYQCKFVSPQAVKHPQLTFFGIDTIADAYLNGSHVATFGNFFREYSVDVGASLNAPGQGNVLVVVIRSPSQALAEIDQPPEESGSIRKEWYLRKGAGDWSSYLGARPRFLTVGIHRDIVLSLTDEAWIEDLQVRTLLLEDSKAVVQVRATCGGTPSGKLVWSVNNAEGNHVASGETPAEITKTIEVEIGNPIRWWPRSHGSAYLYSIEVQLLDDSGALMDASSTRTGLREIKLEQMDPETGEPRFRFIVNGIPVFLRGSCWAPVEGRTHCWQPERARKLLDMAEHCNMNALRVWGGGLLPEDDFYDECDRRGILVWQDFMFEYGMYPTGSPYDENYRAEAIGMVRRLRNHPSIALWVGGNEGHMGWDFAHGDKPAPGRDLYERLLPEVCNEFDGTRPYHPSSPYGGQVPNWPLEGDWHDYTTLTYSPSASVPAFASEVGRVSAPPMRSMRKFLTESELWPANHDGSVRRAGEPSWPPMWGYRAPDGAWDKIAAIEKYCEPTDADSFVRALGLAHGEYLRQRVERHRRGRPNGSASEGRRCWGNLTWRLNDPWPILYWSAIDYFLEPKIPYYFLRRAYSPVLISFEETDDKIAVWIVNDTAEAAAGTLRVERRTFEGTLVGALEERTEVAPNTARRVVDASPLGPITLRTEFLRATFGDLEATWLLCAERYLHLPDAHLKVDIRGNVLLVSSAAFARQVTIEWSNDLEGLFVEDNYFDLAPGTEKAIPLHGVQHGGALTVRALNSQAVTLVL